MNYERDAIANIQIYGRIIEDSLISRRHIATALGGIVDTDKALNEDQAPQSDPVEVSAPNKEETTLAPPQHKGPWRDSMSGLTFAQRDAYERLFRIPKCL